MVSIGSDNVDVRNVNILKEAIEAISFRKMYNFVMILLITVLTRAGQ